MDSLPKGIGDSRMTNWTASISMMSDMDSLPKGIGDLTVRCRYLSPSHRGSDMDSLPKGIGDRSTWDGLRWQLQGVRHGLTAERHW